jgi:hypothetical protein
MVGAATEEANSVTHALLLAFAGEGTTANCLSLTETTPAEGRNP